MQALSPNLMVENMKQTLKFYTSILGFKVTMTVPDATKPVWAMLTNDQVTIMFQERASFIEKVPEFAKQSIGGSFTLYIDVDNIDSLYKKVKKEQVIIVQDLHKTFYGKQEFSIQDNNGYVLSFAQD